MPPITGLGQYLPSYAGSAPMGSFSMSDYRSLVPDPRNPSGITVNPLPGLGDAMVITYPDGSTDIVRASDFASGSTGFAPPAFASTRAGMEFRGAQEMEQLQAQIAADAANALLAQRGAGQRALLGEYGAGARSQLEAGAARQRTLLGEMGAGARAQMEGALAQQLAAGQAVQNIFGQMGQMMAAPSDYLQLAYNVQGLRPMTATPTDLARQEMQKFYGQQMDIAGRDLPTFGSIFQPLRRTVGRTPTFGSIFEPMRKRVPSLQLGGRAQKAAITGEAGPELVQGEDIRVTPNLSRREVQTLRLGGVGKAQLGTSGLGNGGQNVFDIQRQRPGYQAPLFSGGLRKAAEGGVGAVTGLQAISPLDFSLQDINTMLPFEREMLASRFGESIIDPNTGQVMRAGIDPQTAFEIIRRSSLTGYAPAISRWG